MPSLGFSFKPESVEAGLKAIAQYGPKSKQACPYIVKRQTIRLLQEKRPWKVGDTAYCFEHFRTPQIRRLGQAPVREVFTIGMSIYDPNDIAPSPEGRTIVWRLNPLQQTLDIGPLHIANTATGLHSYEIEDLARRDGFNKHLPKLRLFVYDKFWADTVNHIIDCPAYGIKDKHYFKVGDTQIEEVGTPNAIDMLTWFSKAHGDKNGKFEDKFFQVIRW